MSLVLAELIVLSIVLVGASYVGVFFDFKSKLAHDKILADSTASKAVLHKNISIRAIALALAVVCGFLLKSTYDEWKDESRTPNISFQKLAVFMERIGDDTYKVGIEIKLFNSDSKPYLVKRMELSFDRYGVALVPREGYYLPKIMISSDHLEINEDNYLKPYTEGYYKTELPVLIRMKVIGGQPPELLFFSKWKIACLSG